MFATDINAKICAAGVLLFVSCRSRRKWSFRSCFYDNFESYLIAKVVFPFSNKKCRIF